MRLPTKLANIQGMVFEDVASVAVYDGKSGSYAVPDDAKVPENLGSIISDELATISEEICYACDEEPDATSLDKGFMWRR